MNQLLDHLIPPPPVDEHCGVCPEDRAKQLRIGTSIEKEHTKSPARARDIASDHLRENPQYYPTSKKPTGSVEQLDYVARKQSRLAKLKARRPDLYPNG